MPALKILLDECVNVGLGRHLAPHTVQTVTGKGWGGLKNGDLLARAQGEFDVFITVDRNLAFQQNLARFKLAVVVFAVRSNKLADLAPLVPAIKQLLPGFQPGMVKEIRTPA